MERRRFGNAIADDFAYSRISRSPGVSRRIELHSLVGTFPCSPSPTKAAASRAEEGVASCAAGLALLTVASPGLRPGDAPATEPPSEAVVTPPAEGREGDKWVGTGLDGEVMSLSASCDSRDSPSPLRGRSIPEAINFQTFEVESLPVVGEDETSTVDADTFSRSRSVTHKVWQDLEELSADLSVFGDTECLSSAMTKEETVDLAKRLSAMETQLLRLAGKSDSKTDAMRALLQLARRQEKKAAALREKARKQKGHLRTLAALCRRLTDRLSHERTERATARRERAALRAALADGARELRQSEERRAASSAALAAAQARLGHMEGASVRQSRRLLRSLAGGPVPADDARVRRDDRLRELREEERRRAARDAAAIGALEARTAALEEAHAESRRESQRKIDILMEMKAEMEEQVRLLETDESN